MKKLFVLLSAILFLLLGTGLSSATTLDFEAGAVNRAGVGSIYPGVTFTNAIFGDYGGTIEGWSGAAGTDGIIEYVDGSTFVGGDYFITDSLGDDFGDQTGAIGIKFDKAINALSFDVLDWDQGGKERLNVEFFLNDNWFLTLSKWGVDYDAKAEPFDPVQILLVDFNIDVGLFDKVNLHMVVEGNETTGRIGWGIDNLSYNTVPEPATMLLFGLGLLGLAGVSRKKQ